MRLILSSLMVLALPAHAQEVISDPFTDVGFLQSCTTEGEMPGCMVMSYGIRYVAASAGATDPAVMAKLQALPPNSRVAISGDITFWGDITAEVVLKTVIPAPDAKLDALMAQVQGDWQLAPGEGVQIVGSEWTQIVEGQPQNSYLMALNQDCAQGATAGQSSIALILIGGDPMDGFLCYAIDSIDDKSLILTSQPDGATVKLQRS